MTVPHESHRAARLCLEADMRDAMSEAEFWEHVGRSLGSVADVGDDVDQDRLDALQLPPQPCPVCGAVVACAYDAEGQPLIHATEDEESR